MAGTGSKVKIGAAWLTFGSVAGAIGQVIDLGYTQGGITFAIETQGHEVLVDQEGTSPIREQIIGRRVSISTNLAESDYTKLHDLIPDSETSADGTGTLLKIRSGLGADLMDYADILTITSKASAEDWVSIYYAAPLASLSFPFVADRERIYPITFKGYVAPVGDPNAGFLVGMHLGS